MHQLPYPVAGVRLTPEQTLELSAVWACISIVASGIGSCRWNIYQPTGPGKRTLLYDDPLSWLLNTRSNPDMTAIGATISSSETFLRRLFLTFDVDGDGKIDFREFVVGLNGFVKGTPEEKVHALFEIYKSDSTDKETVAISDLLGLFQGDRHLYQELMHCVDEYFARVELRACRVRFASERGAAVRAHAGRMKVGGTTRGAVPNGIVGCGQTNVEATGVQYQVGMATVLADRCPHGRQRRLFSEAIAGRALLNKVPQAGTR